MYDYKDEANVFLYKSLKPPEYPVHNIKDIPIPVNPYDTFKCDVPNLAANLHFLVNDRYYENNHQVEGLPEGVFAGGMKEFAKLHPEIFKKYFILIIWARES